MVNETFCSKIKDRKSTDRNINHQSFWLLIVCSEQRFQNSLIWEFAASMKKKWRISRSMDHHSVDWFMSVKDCRVKSSIFSVSSEWCVSQHALGHPGQTLRVTLMDELVTTARGNAWDKQEVNLRHFLLHHTLWTDDVV